MTGVVNYDVVIRSGDQPVDMDYALETLGGASEVTCLLAEAILQKKSLKEEVLLIKREQFYIRASRVLMDKTLR